MRKRILGFWILLAAPVFAAAPDSVAGKIFRLRLALPGTRVATELTILLGADGKCDALVYGLGQALHPSSYRTFLRDGSFYSSYSYTRTGETTATIEFRQANNSRIDLAYPLIFASDTSGAIALLDSELNSKFRLSDPVRLESAPWMNTSVRGRVSPGHALIAGFIVPGTEEREVLIRVAGPALTALGVNDVWADPDFIIYAGSKPLDSFAMHYHDWSTDPTDPTFHIPPQSPLVPFQKIFSAVGAFPFTPGSKDAARLVRLSPGAYTIVASAPAGDPGGEALIEVYALP